MTHNQLTYEELDALTGLINQEQIDIIDDEENEFWNELRRKLRALNDVNYAQSLLKEETIK